MSSTGTALNGSNFADSATPESLGTTVPLRRDAYGRLVALPRRERARRGDGDRLRGEILEAAEWLLARYGHDDAVSIRAVANRVGCTPPAIYLHFADKTEMLFEVCARRFDDLRVHIDAAIEGIEDPIERLQAGTHAYISFGLDHPEHYRILFMQKALLTPEQWQDLRLTGVSGMERLEGRCQAAIDSGRLRITDARILALSLWQLAHGIISLRITKPQIEWPDPADMTEHLVGTYLDGLLVNPAQGEPVIPATG